ncbi:MAG: DNA polymerase, partial [Candidatus Saccharimonadales bacterium]
GVYENLGLVRDSLRRKLEAGKDSAYMSKQLASIWTDAPIKLDLKELDVAHCQPQDVLDVLQKLEFRSLVRQLPEVMQLPDNAEAPNITSAAFKPGKNHIIDSAAKLAKLQLPSSQPIYVHSRAAGKHGRQPSWLILSTNGSDVYSLNLTKLDAQAVVEHLTKLDSLVGYDVKSSLKLLIELGCTRLPSVSHDVLIGAFLINSLRREQSLSQLAEVDLGYQGASLDELDDQELIVRAPDIMAVIKALHLQQSEVIQAIPKLNKLATAVEWPVIPVLARMEHTGMQLDVDYLKRFAVEIDDSISDLEQQIYGHANREFNIASPSQLATILFDELNLPTAGIKKGKTGYSTAASELLKLRAAHPIIDLISQYREVSKLKSTYVDTLPKQVDDQSRVHTTFSLTVAQTGRLSSSDPNLQNIPVRTELGKRIRTAFVAGPGKLLVSADYSQFELRIAAALSGDQGMVEAFNSGADIHTQTAAAIYGIKSEEVTKQQRYSAKAVNFGIMYGQGPHGLSVGTGMLFGEAKEFIDKYFQIRPGLKAYIDLLREQAKTDGYVETLLGRRRPTPDVHSANFAVREAAYRAAVNMPLQGTAADLMKLAMTEVDKQLEPLNARQLLQIHDSILVECAAADAQKVENILVDVMENIYKLSVKLVVDTTSGSDWGKL